MLKSKNIFILKSNDVPNVNVIIVNDNDKETSFLHFPENVKRMVNFSQSFEDDTGVIQTNIIMLDEKQISDFITKYQQYCLDKIKEK